MIQNEWSDVPPLVPVDSGHQRRPVSQLSEVNDLIALGWEIIDDNPLWEFLPCLWPQQLCGWVTDRSERTMQVFTGPDAAHSEHTWTEADYRQDGLERDSRLRDHFGLEPLPPGRLWFVRTPPEELMTLEAVRQAVEADTERRVGQWASRDLVITADTWLQRWRHS